MRKAYVLIYSATLGTSAQVKAWLNAMPEVLTWRTDLPNCFYIISTNSAQELYNGLEKVAGKRGRFLISEVTSNKQGLLTSESWYLLNNKQHKPKK